MLLNVKYISMVQKQIVMDGRKYNYLETNSEKKQVLVIVHGFRGSHEALVDFAKGFEEYRVIMPDLPAHGESERLDEVHTVEAYARWLVSFLRKLRVARPIIIGHSYGALIALTYNALGFGPKRLVLITPYPEYKTSLIDQAYRVGQFLPEKLTRSVLSSYLFSRYTGNMFFTDQDRARQKQLVKMGQVANGKTPIKIIIEIVEDLKKYRAGDHIGDITSRALLVAGDVDWLIDRQFLALCKNHEQIDVHLIPKAGHLYPLERPADAAEGVIDWLKSSWKTVNFMVRYSVLL